MPPRATPTLRLHLAFDPSTFKHLNPRTRIAHIFHVLNLVPYLYFTRPPPSTFYYHELTCTSLSGQCLRAKQPLLCELTTYTINNISPPRDALLNPRVLPSPLRYNTSSTFPCKRWVLKRTLEPATPYDTRILSRPSRQRGKTSFSTITFPPSSP